MSEDDKWDWKGMPDDWCLNCGAPMYEKDYITYEKSPEGFDVPTGEMPDYCQKCMESHTSAAILSNGDIVRVKPGVTLSGIDRDGETRIVTEGRAGQVLWADAENCVVIFPLRNKNETGPLQPHLVRVECLVDQLYKDNRANPFGF